MRLLNPFKFAPRSLAQTGFVIGLLLGGLLVQGPAVAQAPLEELVGVQLELPHSRILAGQVEAGQDLRLKLRVTEPGAARASVGGQILDFSELRSTASLSRLQLLDPNGAVVWTLPATQLTTVSADLTANPLGHVSALPPRVSAPAPGEWTLVATASQTGRLVVSYRLWQRYALTVPMQTVRVSAGQPWVMAVTAWDAEQPGNLIAPPTVVVRGDSGRVISRTTATASLTTQQGAVIPAPPGTFYAVLRFPRAGVFRVQADGSIAVGPSTSPGSKATPDVLPLAASILIDVGPAAMDLANSSADPGMASAARLH